MGNNSEQFASQYFTGTQASLWIGDIWVDEVYAVAYMANQSVIPVYGYASTFFDAVARGKVLVQGSFEINFVDEGYLYAILAEAYAKWSQYVPGNGQPFDLNADIIDKKFSEKKRTTADVLKDQVALLKEVNGILGGTDSIAGARSIQETNRKQILNSIMNTMAELDVTSATQLGRSLAETKSQDVDLNIIYKMVPFNLRGHFGNPELFGKDQGTYKELKDCFLVGNEMVIGSNDDLVRERYSFISRVHV